MSLLGKKLSIPVLENSGIEDNQTTSVGTNFDYCLENYGDITLEEDIFMEQLALMESFHELDCIENAYYADRILMESASVGDFDLEEREALFEADQEGAKSSAIDKIIGMIKRVTEKVKGLYNSLISFISSKFNTVDTLVNKYGNIIKDGSCEMEMYEYKEVGPDNSYLQDLNCNRISQNLNSLIGGQLGSALSTSPEAQKGAMEKLTNYRKQLGKFDHKEICNVLRGKKETRKVSGAELIKILKDKTVIGDMKKQVNAFNKAAADVANGVIRTKQDHKGQAESIQLINAYATAFNAQAQASIRCARCVIEVAQERCKVAVHGAKKILKESKSKGGSENGADSYFDEVLKNLNNKANNRTGMDL